MQTPLATARKRKGLTQAQLAGKIGKTRSTIAMYEAEKNDMPGAVLLSLSQVLGVSVDELLGKSLQRTSPRSPKR